MTRGIVAPESSWRRSEGLSFRREWDFKLTRLFEGPRAQLDPRRVMCVREEEVQRRHVQRVFNWPDRAVRKAAKECGDLEKTKVKTKIARESC